MSRFVRILLISGIAVIVGGVLFSLFGAQAFTATEARNTERKLPFVGRVPTALTDSSISREPGITLDYFGYQFEVPWTDVDQEKTKIVGDNKVVIAFRSGNVISLWSGPAHELIDNVMAQAKLNRETAAQLYGEEALQSDYSFMRLVLETTPSSIHLFSPRGTAARQMMLLLIKATATPGDPNSGIFEIKTASFTGFQYGNPTPTSKIVSVELFPQNRHLDVMFFPNQAGPTPIRQADINRVVQTIRDSR